MGFMGCCKKKTKPYRCECHCADCKAHSKANANKRTTAQNRPPPSHYSPEPARYSQQDFSAPPAPPPYGNEDLWELQFCRWWGWNWVRKREDDGTQSPARGNRGKATRTVAASPGGTTGPCAAGPATVRPNQRTATMHSRAYCSPQASNKDRVKNFCDCLFKKKGNELPPSGIQNLYDTPSNSVVVCETYACGMVDRENDTFERIDVSRSVSKQSRGDQYRGPACMYEEQKRSTAQAWGGESTSSSEEEIEVQIVCNGMARQAAEEGCQQFIDYKSSRERLTKESKLKNTGVQALSAEMNNNCTQTCGTTEICQTKNVYPGENQQQYKSVKRVKARRIRVVTCCCCPEQNGAAKGKPTPENKYEDPPPKPRVLIRENRSNSDTGAGRRDSQNKTDNKKDRRPSRGSTDAASASDLDMKRYRKNPLTAYAVLNPTTFFPSSQKNFSKFGKPSQNYPWLHTSLSERISSNSWIDEEFRSPISGKVYSIQPSKLKSLNSEKNITLPELIDIRENLNYLRNVESKAKTDYEKRIMMDALCDAILSGDDNDFRKKSSMFLNQFSYDVNRQDSFYSIGAERFKTNKDFGQQFSYQTNDLNKNILEQEFINKYRLNTLDENIPTQKIDKFTEDHFTSQCSSEKSCDTVIEGFTFNLNKRKSSVSKEPKLFTARETLRKPSFTRTGLMSTVLENPKTAKRSRSPNLECSTNKRAKQKHTSTSDSETNMAQIFEKINDLVTKRVDSKKSDEPSVTSPKRSLQISPRSSHEPWPKILDEVDSSDTGRSSTNHSQIQQKSEKTLTHINFMVCDTKSTTDCVNVKEEQKKPTNNRTKSTSRVSLIPVRKGSSFQPKV